MEKTNPHFLEKLTGYFPLLITALLILFGLNYLYTCSFAWKFSWIGLVALAGGVIAREYREISPTYAGILVGVITFLGMSFLYDRDIFLPVFAFIMASTGAEYAEGFSEWKGKSFLKKVLLPAVLTPIAGFILLPLAFSIALNSSEETPTPELSFVTVEGESVLPEDTKGKVVILDFWGTWCGPCLAAFPDMEKLYDDYKENEEVAFWFLNTLGNGDNPERVKAFLARKNYQLPMALTSSDYRKR